MCQESEGYPVSTPPRPYGRSCERFGLVVLCKWSVLLCLLPTPPLARDTAVCITTTRLLIDWITHIRKCDGQYRQASYHHYYLGNMGMSMQANHTTFHPLDPTTTTTNTSSHANIPGIKPSVNCHNSAESCVWNAAPVYHVCNCPCNAYNSL